MKLKHLWKQTICFVLISIICITILPASVQAAEQKGISSINIKYAYKSAGTLTADTTTKIKSRVFNNDFDNPKYTYYCYKISIPENGYIKLTAWLGEASYADVCFLPAPKKCNTSLYASQNALVSVDYNSRSGGTKQAKYLSLNKGTYYLCTDASIKIKYSFYKSTSTTNYCKAKASSLAAEKNKIICFNKGYEYDRWYKIKLTSKKAISITWKILGYSNSLYYTSFTLYDSKGKEISCPQLDGDVYRTAKQPIGVYYIRITTQYLNSGAVVSIKWK